MASKTPTEKPLTGKKFAIVGSMPGAKIKIDNYYIYSQYDLAQRIRVAGGTTTGGTSYYSSASPLTKSCDYLVLGAKVKKTTLDKLETETYKNVIPISLDSLAKVINGKAELPTSREEYEKQLKKIKEEEARKEVERKKLEEVKRYVEFAKRCGIKYNINEPESSEYIAKKMDVSVTHLLESTTSLEQQPIRIPIKTRRM
jgi:hypothetical protein